MKAVFAMLSMVGIFTLAASLQSYAEHQPPAPQPPGPQQPVPNNLGAAPAPASKPLVTSPASSAPEPKAQAPTPAPTNQHSK